jgi:hypothetical protein
MPLEGAGLNEAETGSAGRGGAGAVGAGLVLGRQADATSVRQPTRIHPRFIDQLYRSTPRAVPAAAALLALGPVHLREVGQLDRLAAADIGVRRGKLVESIEDPPALRLG